MGSFCILICGRNDAKVLVLQMNTSNTEAASSNLRLLYNYRPDSDLYIIYNVGTQFASIAPANPPQIRETRFAVKWTYSFAP
jgi:hypothetical protein